VGWVIEITPKVDLKRVKRHLEAGRAVLEEMHEGNITTCNIGDVEPDL
jgi:hypothetical protein